MAQRHARSVEDHRWVTLDQIAAEIARTRTQTKKLIRRTNYLGFDTRKKGRTTLYSASTLEVLKAMLAVPHRPVPSPGGDWLTQWIGDPDHERGLQPRIDRDPRTP